MDSTPSLLLIAAVLIYFFPSAMLVGKHKRNALAIVLLNVLAGWTIIGWLIALIWAATKDAPAVIVQPPAAG